MLQEDSEIEKNKQKYLEIGQIRKDRTDKEIKNKENWMSRISIII